MRFGQLVNASEYTILLLEQHVYICYLFKSLLHI